MIDDILTLREKEVIRLIAKGYANEEIMKTLRISKGTFHTHHCTLYQKLNISNYSGLGNAAKRLRLALAYIKEHRELLDELDEV